MPQSSRRCVAATVHTRAGTTRLTATRTWDANRLTTVNNTWNTGARSLDTTFFDAMNRRTTVQWQDGSKWRYDYNDRGEVIAGGRKWNDAALVNGQQYAYSFDTIGNRTGTLVNGRAASYGAGAGWPGGNSKVSSTWAWTKRVSGSGRTASRCSPISVPSRACWKWPRAMSGSKAAVIPNAVENRHGTMSEA